MNRRRGYLLNLSRMWRINVRAVAEIGVYRGRFAGCLRTNWPAAELYLIDPWRHLPNMARQNGRMHKAGGSPEANQAIWDIIYAEVQGLFANDPHTHLIRATSAEAAPGVADESLDVIHIDGDHSYEAVCEDITLWLPKLRPGGMLCGHDYAESGRRRTLFKVKPAVDDMLGAANIRSGANTTWAYRKAGNG